MEDPGPNWHAVRQKLAHARTIAGEHARRLALREVIEDVIKVFETSAPTEWEAHFLLYAIHHIDSGYPAVAAEEIASVMKPRHQQVVMADALPRLGTLWRLRTGADSSAMA
jgi:hypothetical protein